MWNIKDIPHKDRTTKMCLIHAFQAFIMIQLISSARKAGLSQLCQKFALFALILLLLSLMRVVNTELVSSVSVRMYMHHWRFMYISCWLSQCIHRRVNVVQNKCRMTKLQFQGTFEEQGIFHLTVNFNLTMHFSLKGLPLFTKTVLYFCLHPSCGFTLYPIRGGHNQANNWVPVWAFSPLATKRGNKTWLTSIFSTYLYLHGDWKPHLITSGSATTGEVDKSNYYQAPKA